MDVSALMNLLVPYNGGFTTGGLGLSALCPRRHISSSDGWEVRLKPPPRVAAGVHSRSWARGRKLRGSAP